MVQALDPASFTTGLVTGIAAGMLSLLLFQYTGRILRQPKLVPQVVLANPADFTSVEAHALHIAEYNLRSAIERRRLPDNKTRQILHAGYRNFRESWARDFGFASFGLMDIGQPLVVRDTLEAFLEHQTAEGSLPVKLHSINALTRVFHSVMEREQPIGLPLRPKYFSAHGSPSLDGQALLVIAAVNYSRETDNLEFLRLHWQALLKAIAWIERSARDPNGELLIQGPFADWEDSIDRRGRVLYTNVLYWQALREMSEAATCLGIPDLASLYGLKAGQLAAAIQTGLWRPALGYFAASDTLDHLASSGNLLSIVWGLATEDQAGSILDALARLEMDRPVPTKVAVPSYPMRLIALENRLAGVHNYHTDAAWMWIGAWHVIALAMHHRLEESHQVLARMAKVIVRDGQIHEVYSPDGSPLSNFWYQSEAPLTWNAGMIVHAFHVLEKHIHHEPDAA